MKEGDSCDITAKNSCCSSPAPQKMDYKAHWDATYSSKPTEKLGWYETDLSPMLNLIETAHIRKDACILNVGAGSTTLIDELLQLGYSNLIATDISEVALNVLKARIGTGKCKLIVDDLTEPTTLKNIPKIDVWIDRAVLHFFLTEKEQNTYFDLLRSKVKDNGYVIFAEFSMEGATKCSGLKVHRYDNEQFQNKLGNGFRLIKTFDYTYIMPSGESRAYIYSLFRRS